MWKKKKKNHQGSQFQPSLAEGKLRQHCILRFLLHTTYLKQKTQTAVKLFSVNQNGSDVASAELSQLLYYPASLKCQPGYRLNRVPIQKLQCVSQNKGGNSFKQSFLQTQTLKIHSECADFRFIYPICASPRESAGRASYTLVVENRGSFAGSCLIPHS